MVRRRVADCPGGETLEIAELMVNCAIRNSVIDVQILVHEDVAETRPPSTPLSEGGRQFACAFEDGERVAILVRRGQRSIGDPMIRQIETGLDRQVQVALGKVVKRRLSDELSLVGVTKRAKLCQVAAQRLEPSREDLAIDHRSCRALAP
jgi:hypothetical protein